MAPTACAARLHCELLGSTPGFGAAALAPIAPTMATSFFGAQSRHKAAVDPILAPPRVDRLGADTEIPRHLDHRPSGLDKVEHPTTELQRIATPSHADLLNSSSTRIQLRDSTKPGEDQCLHQKPGRFIHRGRSDQHPARHPRPHLATRPDPAARGPETRQRRWSSTDHPERGQPRSTPPSGPAETRSRKIEARSWPCTYIWALRYQPLPARRLIVRDSDGPNCR